MFYKFKLLLTFSSVMLLVVACGSNSEIQAPEGENPYQVEFSAPEYLKQHAKYIEEELFQIGDHQVWDYNTPNKGFGNVIMIEGDSGIIIIDTTVSHDNAVVANTVFREITDKPVKAIIYTHHHADHIRGAGAFVDPEMVKDDEIQIIAASNFMRELSDENQMTGPLMALRATHMYGLALDPTKEGRDYHISCCGYTIRSNSNSFIRPNKFIDDAEEITIAGVRLQFFLTGGESASHLAVYMPETKIMFIGDEIQGPNYPNLHSLRGTKPRDASKWIAAFDKILAFDIDYLVPSHGQPVLSKQQANKVLITYRDSIQFTHDQSIRYINKGYTPDELANTIELPDYLSIEPWTKEMYGTVKHNVREYFVAYISWWNGDPAELDPTPRVEKASRMVALMGGHDSVLAEAEKALKDGDPQWASELSALLVRIDNNDMQARYLKAAAFRTIGYKTENTNWRGFYLTGALELEGKVDPNVIQQRATKGSFRPAQFSTVQLLNLLRYKINAENVADRRLKVAYKFTDTNENFTLEFRNSILQVHDTKLADSDITMTMQRATLNAVFRQELAYKEAIDNGDIKIEGSLIDLYAFSNMFDISPANAYSSLR